MKNILTLILSITVLFTLGSCAPDENNSSKTDYAEEIGKKSEFDAEKATNDEAYIGDKEPIVEELQLSSGAVSYTSSQNTNKSQFNDDNVIAFEPQLNHNGKFAETPTCVGSGITEDPPFVPPFQE